MRGRSAIHRSTVVLCLLLLFGAGCTGGDQAPDGTAIARQGRFLDDFELVREVTLEQPDAHVISRMLHMVPAGDGMLLVVDGSESNLKLYGPDGPLRQVIGGRGDGPGELRGPVAAAFSGSSILVLDGQRMTLSRYRTDGSFVEERRLTGFALLHDLMAVDGERSLLLALPIEQRGGAVAHRLDASLLPTGAFLASGDLVPTGQTSHSVWEMMRGSYGALESPSRAVIVHTLSDTVWTVDPRSGEVTEAVRLQVPGMIAPSQPPEATDFEAVLAFSRQFHSARRPAVFDGVVLIPFVQGSLGGGDPVLTVARSRNGRWTSYVDAPPVVAATEEGFVTLATPGEQAFRVAYFRPRSGYQ